MNYPKASQSTINYFKENGPLRVRVEGLPPSKSNTYAPGRTKDGKPTIRKGKEVKAYERKFGLQVGRYRDLMLDGMLSVKIVVFVTNIRKDMDNCAKTVHDCLEKTVIIKNDYMIYDSHVMKCHSEKGYGYVDIFIEGLELKI